LSEIEAPPLLLSDGDRTETADNVSIGTSDVCLDCSCGLDLSSTAVAMETEDDVDIGGDVDDDVDGGRVCDKDVLVTVGDAQEDFGDVVIIDVDEVAVIFVERFVAIVTEAVEVLDGEGINVVVSSNVAATEVIESVVGVAEVVIVASFSVSTEEDEADDEVVVPVVGGLSTDVLLS